MENSIYNELVRRGYTVDVGVVEYKRKQSEITFIANRSLEKVYIHLPKDVADMEFQKRVLLTIRDNFPKIIITRTLAKRWVDEDGIIHLGLYEFLLEDDVLR